MSKYDKLKKINSDAMEKTKKEVSNIYAIAEESKRVSNIAHHAGEIISDLDRQFAEKTGLDGKDIAFLFLATGLQLARWIILNQITQIERAGSGNQKEEALHQIQKKILKMLNSGEVLAERPYYASLNQIVSTDGVPYDATASLTKNYVEKLIGKGAEWGVELTDLFPDNLSLFKGANHRFATLGHDPILGLVFGTANIMTNTITCVKKPMITTNHVVYTTCYKYPQIATYGSTAIMLSEVLNRTIDEPNVFVAALIKQIVHIGTDLYTPCGIQIPAANLVLSNKNAETITKYISTGDVVKAGNSAMVAKLINILIEVFHGLLYEVNKFPDRDFYTVKTRKIIMYSNAIASTSNIIWVGANMALGNEEAIKELDIGGLLVTIRRLVTDYRFMQEIKQEFLEKEWYNLVMGEDYNCYNGGINV